jgi:hypothetical protein
MISSEELRSYGVLAPLPEEVVHQQRRNPEDFVIRCVDEQP